MARAVGWLSLLRRAGATEVIVYEESTALVPAREHAELHVNMIAVLFAIVLVLAVIWFRAYKVVRIHFHVPFVSLEMERREPDRVPAEVGEIELEDDLVFHDAEADTWACAACTFINEANVEACEMCDTLRGEPVLQPADDEAGELHADGEPEPQPPLPLFAPDPVQPTDLDPPVCDWCGRKIDVEHVYHCINCGGVMHCVCYRRHLPCDRRPVPQAMPAPTVLQGSWGLGQHAQRYRLVEESKRVPCPTCRGFRRKTVGSNNHFIRVSCACGALLRRERVLSHAEVRAL